MGTLSNEALLLGRRPMNQIDFDQEYGFKDGAQTNIKKEVVTKLKDRYVKPFSSRKNIWKTIISFVPIISWLPKYSIKQNLIYDIIGGITVGLMHIPQGIAYSSLARQEPQIGLYTSFFAPLAYMLFGTSRHNSIGTFAVVSLMAGNAVKNVEKAYPGEYEPIDVVISLTCVGGLIQMLISAVGLSFVTTYFSDEVVGGFTTGAAVYVFMTQLKDIFGIRKLEEVDGLSQIFKSLINIIKAVPTINPVTLSLSMTVLAILVLARYIINPLFQKKTRSPVAIPFDLIVLFYVVLGTLASWLLDLENGYHVKTVGKIPSGFPTPKVPKPYLFLFLLPDATSIAVVVIAIHISMAKVFGKRFNYPVDTTQEFYALGFTSIISSFFQVFPNCCSLSRSMVCANSGTKTQLFALFSSALILLTLFLGKFLQPLPMAILAAIIIVALIAMFEKASVLPKLWKLSKIDFAIWVVSFLATVTTDVSIGLGISILFALFTTIARIQWAKRRILVNISGTSDYRDMNRYENVLVFEGICILRFDAPLMFSNVERFRNMISDIISNQITDNNADNSRSQKSGEKNLYCIIIDCSPFVFVDLMGVNTLKEVYLEMEEKEIIVAFAAARGFLRDMFYNCDDGEKVPRSAFYPTIHDAVCLAKNPMDIPVTSTETSQSRTTMTTTTNSTEI